MLHGFTSQQQMLFTSHRHYNIKSDLDASFSATQKLKIEQKFSNIYIYIWIYMYILPSVSLIRYSTALKTEAVRLYCTETTVNLYQTVRLAFQRTVLFITLHPIIKIRRYLLLFRGNNFVCSEKVIRVTSTAFEGVLLLLSIGPRWLMPRMYCSHIGLLYYP